ncbi:MAG TPA: preQ(1) synthase [Rhizomicrobium sp.]|jgi:7-cyano-7-deazaguanine reductase|nr:preQ(1) synthase [Rhizomicrobium sp.]
MAKKLTQLGRPVAPPSSPDKAKLESVSNPHIDADYVVRFTAPEFTTLCPITGQPDFAHFVIDYVPDKAIVESKSLKLFLTSFRNASGFHEATTIMIAKRIAAAIKPKYLRIAGYWYPRGGMPIDIFWQTGKLPRDVWLPDTGVSSYRGRG